MKIGILTFHRALNYGAVMQCFALQESIKSLGHEVEVIDYRPWYLEKYRQLFSYPYFISQKNLVYGVKYVIRSFLTFKEKKRSCMAFNSFLKKHISISRKVNVLNVNCFDQYDCIIVGSDQVWNKRITFGFDNFFYGNFKREYAKLISYAASFGETSTITDLDRQNIGNLLSNFNAISTREGYAKMWIEENFRIKATEVLDPTLLLEKNVYERILIKPKIEGKYVFVFCLNGKVLDASLKFGRQIANQIGNCMLITLNAVGKNESSDDILCLGGINPEEYLGLIKYAECIVAVSFHAVAFSITFRKDFYSIQNVAEGRAKNILGKLDLLERHVNPYDAIKFSKVNYHPNFNECLLANRQHSINFLTTNIGGR